MRERFNHKVVTNIFMAIFLVFFILISFGCVTGDVKTRIKLPSRNIEMQKPQMIMVVGFTGNKGDVATELIQKKISDGGLHNLTIGTKQDRALTEKLLQSSGDESSTSLKDLAGEATIIVTGNVSDEDYTDHMRTSYATKCSYKDSSGKCLSEDRVPTHTLIESCTTELTGKVFRVADGKLLLEKKTSGMRVLSVTMQNTKPVSTREEVCRQAFMKALNRFTRYITPYYSNVTLEFQPIKDSKGQNEMAIENAKRNQFEDAHNNFKMVIQDSSLNDEERAWARYNDALTLWAIGKTAQCAEQLKKAREVLGDEKKLKNWQSQCENYYR